MRRIRSLSRRLYISHVLVAFATSLTAVLAVLALLAISVGSSSNADQVAALLPSAFWLFELDDDEVPPGISLPRGATIITDEDMVILYTYGETSCEEGELITGCFELRGEFGETIEYRESGKKWVETSKEGITGLRLYSRSEKIGGLVTLLPALVFPTLILMILSLPVALLLARIVTGGLTKRLDAITQANQSFAEGDFKVRVVDDNNDDVGQLAQQFNSMADVLAQNVHTLRDLAQQNAELAKQAELAAVQAERVRLSRDLHDSIAQQLFSLSMNAASLPDTMKNDPKAALPLAERIANLAEQAQMDLRSLLVDLRPSTVIQRGLNEALQELCDEWHTNNQIKVETSFLLRGRSIPAGLQDVIYRVAQEGLNNIARHAEASRATVSLLEGQHQITLSITDDGQGFDASQGTPAGHFGLMGIRERARMVGGAVTIESEVMGQNGNAQGTTLMLVIPLAQEEHKGHS